MKARRKLRRGSLLASQRRKVRRIVAHAMFVLDALDEAPPEFVIRDDTLWDFVEFFDYPDVFTDAPLFPGFEKDLRRYPPGQFRQMCRKMRLIPKANKK